MKLRSLLALFPLFFAAEARAFQIDELHGCGGAAPAEHARENCGDFDSLPAFALSLTIQEAKTACLEFYGKAWEANHLTCSFASYVKDVKTQAPSVALGKKDEAVRSDFLDRFRLRHEELKRAAEKYQNRIGRVASESFRSSSAEMNCSFARDSTAPAAVNGLMEMGLANKAQADYLITRPSITLALRVAASQIPRTKGQGLVPTQSVELSDPEAPPELNQGPIKRPPVPPEEPANSNMFDAVNTMTQFYAQNLGDRFLAGWAKSLSRTHPALVAKVPRLAKLVPKYGGSVASGGLSVGLQYIWTGKVGALDLLSIGVTSYSFGAGLFMDIAIAGYRDNQDNRREFADFVDKRLKKNPAETSASVANAWAAEKKRNCGVKDPFADLNGKVGAAKKADASKPADDSEDGGDEADPVSAE